MRAYIFYTYCLTTVHNSLSRSLRNPPQDPVSTGSPQPWLLFLLHSFPPLLPGGTWFAAGGVSGLGLGTCCPRGPRPLRCKGRPCLGLEPGGIVSSLSSPGPFFNCSRSVRLRVSSRALLREGEENPGWGSRHAGQGSGGTRARAQGLHAARKAAPILIEKDNFDGPWKNK